jgi:hypothetical protein
MYQPLSTGGAQLLETEFTVTYNGNGSTGGSVPVDSNTYNMNESITVLGNTGSLVRDGFDFAGWTMVAL